jgi:hypothetical protein
VLAEWVLGAAFAQLERLEPLAGGGDGAEEADKAGQEAGARGDARSGAYSFEIDAETSGDARSSRAAVVLPSSSSARPSRGSSGAAASRPTPSRRRGDRTSRDSGTSSASEGGGASGSGSSGSGGSSSSSSGGLKLTWENLAAAEALEQAKTKSRGSPSPSMLSLQSFYSAGGTKYRPPPPTVSARFQATV